MKVIIVCASVSHGNTRKVADRMAAVLDAEVREPNEVGADELGSCDLVGFGSGIYMMAVHPSLRDLVRSLPSMPGHRAFVFATSGAPALPCGWWRPTRSVESDLQSKGFELMGQFSCRGLDTVGPLGLIGGINKGHPNEGDLVRAESFAKEIRDWVEQSPDRDLRRSATNRKDRPAG